MSQLYIRPFMPKGNTVSIPVGLVSATIAVTRPSVGVQSVRILNYGSQTIYITIGNSSATASTTSSMPMLPYTVETFSLPNDATHIACIATYPGSTMYVTTGESA